MKDFRFYADYGSPSAKRKGGDAPNVRTPMEQNTPEDFARLPPRLRWGLWSGPVGEVPRALAAARSHALGGALALVRPLVSRGSPHRLDGLSLVYLGRVVAEGKEPGADPALVLAALLPWVRKVGAEARADGTLLGIERSQRAELVEAVAGLTERSLGLARRDFAPHPLRLFGL